MSVQQYIRRVFIGVIALFIPVSDLLSQSAGLGLDERINEAFMPFAIAWEDLILATISIGSMEIPIVLILLIGGATYFTIYHRRARGHDLKICRVYTRR